jgi:ammonium transporter, Amt family
MRESHSLGPRTVRTLLAAGLAFLSLPAFAQEAAPPAVNSGDTAWLLTSTALVMLMTAPGLALFYGGLVSHRNYLSTLMHSFFLLCLISVQWVLFGYTLAFGPDRGGLIGGLDFLFFGGVGQDPIAGQTIPHLAFAIYQGVFAVITPALITGAFAERMRFSAFVLFSLLWATLVYDPLAHWVWGGGWLMKRGALDFAGGTVVHISSGVSALIAAIMVGRRRGHPHASFPPHCVPMTLLGGSLLWFGWFGFNAGSALGASGLAASAFVTTHTAAAVTGLSWALIEWVHRGKPTVLGSVTGAVAGLVAITPAAGYVTVPAAFAIGIGCAVICYLGVNLLKPRFGYDDSLDVFGVHGLGGTWGALATGLFATKAVNPAGADGLFYGNPGQLGIQFLGVAAGWVLAIVGTFLILSLVKLVVPLRVADEDEITGLDVSLHGEVAYNFGGSVGVMAFAVSGGETKKA